MWKLYLSHVKMVSYTISEGWGEAFSRIHPSLRFSLTEELEEALEKKPKIWTHWIAAHAHLEDGGTQTARR